MQDRPKMAEVDFKTATSTMEALARISVSSSVYVGEITAALGCPAGGPSDCVLSAPR